MKKIILLLLLFSYKGYSEEIKYTKSGIPIRFIGLLDVDHSNVDTNSIIYKIIQKEKELIRNNLYISSTSNK
jgi:hypothetical protein